MTATLPEKRKCSEKLCSSAGKAKFFRHGWKVRSCHDQRWTVDAKKTSKRFKNQERVSGSHLTRNQNQRYPASRQSRRSGTLPEVPANAIKDKNQWRRTKGKRSQTPVKAGWPAHDVAGKSTGYHCLTCRFPQFAQPVQHEDNPQRPHHRHSSAGSSFGSKPG